MRGGPSKGGGCRPGLTEEGNFRRRTCSDNQTQTNIFKTKGGGYGFLLGRRDGGRTQESITAGLSVNGRGAQRLAKFGVRVGGGRKG